jgi:predicted SnoaL-like aldol condensation-catalyzing enzyme
MKLRHVASALSVGLLVTVAASHGSRAQVPVVGNPDHESMLASKDPALAANKRLVYDFWREVFEAGQMDLAPKYLAEGYIQHNPTVPTGRAAFVDYFQKSRKPKPVEPKITAPVVSIVAEGDYVVLGFVRTQPDPADAGRTFTTTWFDMFRLENGKIAEHWDPAVKR